MAYKVTLNDLSDDETELLDLLYGKTPPQNKRGFQSHRPKQRRLQPPHRNRACSGWGDNHYLNSSPDCSVDQQDPLKYQASETSSTNIYYQDQSNTKAIIPISVLSYKAQGVFKFSHFNKMQSRCFLPMYEQDYNCVISSPTGSGKTVLFELAILRLLNTNTNVSNIKILYIAPTKALCDERGRDWQNKFSTFGLNVGILTSDTSFNESEKVKRCNIIITTPEKWDLMTRKWSDYTKLFDLVKVLLIDEIHILREDRGSTLEVVVTRMKKLCAHVRIVALSATVPNIQDIASWIKLDSHSSQNAITMVFGEEYRPVKLEKVICGYRQSANDFVFDSFLNPKLVEVLNEHSMGKSVLVFCPTRSSTVSTAKYIAKNFLSHMNFSPPPSKIRERELADAASKGVAYHHAGLSMDDRLAIEKSFIAGSIKVLCSTSTLAVGVNLPAYLVVIKGTKIWSNTQFEEYSELDVLQMMGRAGRPQFETQGKAVLMTNSDMLKRYEQLVKGNQKLESRLHLNLHENLVSEVHLKTINSSNDALDWLKHTFFYARYHSCPTAYGEIPTYPNTDLDGRLMSYCDGKLRELTDFRLIKAVNGTYESTPYGDSMTRHYILFETIKKFIKAPKGVSIGEIIQLLANAVEFKSIRLKRTEKRLFKEINNSPILRFPSKLDKKRKNIEEGWEKISLLIQYELGGLEYPNDQDLVKLQQSFKQDKLYVFKHIGRLLRCLIDVCVEKKDFISLRNCLSLASCVSGGCWNDTSMVLKQLDGINLSHVRRLTSQSVKSFTLIQLFDSSKIEYVLGLRPGNGAKIKGQVESLPVISVRSKIAKIVKPRDGSGLKLSVESNLDISSGIQKWKGRNITLVFTAGLSTGEVVDFRRNNISRISGNTSLTCSFSIEYVGTRLETYVYCEEIAGVGASCSMDLTSDLSDNYMKVLKRSSPKGTEQHHLNPSLFLRILLTLIHQMMSSGQRMILMISCLRLLVLLRPQRDHNHHMNLKEVKHRMVPYNVNILARIRLSVVIFVAVRALHLPPLSVRRLNLIRTPSR